jgi:hypothetical protein
MEFTNAQEFCFVLGFTAARLSQQSVASPYALVGFLIGAPGD